MFIGDKYHKPTAAISGKYQKGLITRNNNLKNLRVSEEEETEVNFNDKTGAN